MIADRWFSDHVDRGVKSEATSGNAGKILRAPIYDHSGPFFK
jgi:hypothetical protein